MTTRRLAGGAGVVALVALASASALAIYAQVDIQNVPVARLVQNLERELAKNPKDPETHLRLARLYAMAFFANKEELPATVLAGAPETGARQEVWFGHEPPLLPGNVDPGAARTAAAKSFLKKAIDHYKVVLELDADSLAGRLGYAWTLQQSGNTAAAIEQYRGVVTRAWPKEQNARFAMLGQHFFTAEAVRYLIPLLDSKRDAAEIEELTARAAKLRSVPRPITPIAVPLAEDATVKTIVDLDATVPFDADGAGMRRSWTWIKPTAGWLVYDAGGKGRITSALQWFGNVTFWLFWNNGYDALASLDDNRDGQLTGAELRHLAVWRDANADGVSDPGEVRPVAAYDIVAISCRYTRGDGLLVSAMSESGITLAGGRVRPTYDVILRPSIVVSGP